MSNMPRLSAAQERTREWLEAQEEDDELESIAESSVVDSLDDYKYSEHTYTEQEDDDDDDDGEEVSTIALGTQGDSRGTIIRDTLRDLLNSINSIQTVGNVNISNSTNVHIGNVTNINGNIQIIAETTTNSAPRSTRNTHRVRRKAASPSPDNDEQHSSNVPDELEEAEERVNANVFISRQKFKIPKELCSIVPRHSWLAQMPMEKPAKLQLPVKYVVILHTATESSEKRAINVRLIRDIQCFHIESRGWNDIAYNFLIGCDGNIYEGRGWQAVGAHTLGYNRIALGVSFVGCFMRELPTQDALNMCRNLLARGVEDGYIDPDYRLICHCQCNSTESPGRMLFEEIQTWPHFYNIVQADDL